MKSAFKNSLWGLVSQFITVLFSIILQRIFIEQLGIEYQGLNSVMNSLVSVFSLAELGIGTAIIFSLYEPIIEKDEKKIISLINLFKKLYLVVALLIIIIGMLSIPFLKFFIKNSNFENAYIHIVLILFVIRAAVSYVGAEYSSLLFANQKNHVALLIKVVVDCISQVIQISVIIFLKDYLLQLMVLIFATAATNIITAYKTKRMYPFLKEKVLSAITQKDIRSFVLDVKELSISKVADILIFQTDNLLLAFFYNEIIVGFYSNYLLIIQGLNAFVNRVCQGIQPTIVSIVINKKKNEEDYFYLFQIYYMILVSVISCMCCYCILFLQDFVALYFGENYLLSNRFVYFAVIAQYYLWVAQPVWLLCYANGLFKEIKQNGLLAAIVNIVASCCLTIRYKELGIILGTVICYITSNLIYMLIIYRKKLVDEKKIKTYACYFFTGCISTSLLMLGMEWLNGVINHIVGNVFIRVAIKFPVGIILPILYNILVFGKTEYASEMFEFIKGYFNKRKMEGYCIYEKSRF